MRAVRAARARGARSAREERRCAAVGLEGVEVLVLARTGAERSVERDGARERFRGGVELSEPRLERGAVEPREAVARVDGGRLDEIGVGLGEIARVVGAEADAV